MGKTPSPPRRDRPHDRPRRLLFSHPQVVEDLLRGFVDEPWVDELDFETLDRDPEISIAETLDERISDIVWRVRWGASDIYLLLLVEFQSRSDRWMALRLLVYVGQLYQELVRRGRVLSGRRLPPVFPIVIYNGLRPWRAPIRLSGLIAAAHPDLRRNQPELGYHLLDERRLPIVLGERRNLMPAIAALEQSESAQRMGEVVGHLSRWLRRPDQAPLRRAFAAWLRYVLLPARFDDTMVIPELDDLLEVKNMLEDTVRGWTRQWLAEGRAEGRAEGERKGHVGLLERQLRWKFGPLPEDARRRLNQASDAQLLDWSRRLLTAGRLEDVWSEP